MTSYRTQPIDEFLSGIASRRVTPAGGSASAVSGAIGASLCEMVCLHTVEKAGDDAVSHTGGCNSFTHQSLLAAETDPFRLDAQFECSRTYSHQYEEQGRWERSG